MSKVFVLRAPEHGHALVSYIKSLAGPMAASGRPLMVTVEEYGAKRSSEQNRLLWALLTEISEQVELNGKRFAKEAWYAHYLDLYAPKQEGPRGLVPVGSSQMTKEQFANFVTRIECHAAQELGVEFAAI
ncbi:ninB family protein [Burkholderia multivorans]|uniref:NinB family protein n=1 Tax=Burkholderia multivorans TaxID=87883 RepID=A0ABD7L6M9_9BURK|nr:recombination protein NinB [Burkholderia multivorans]SAJ95490.1 ninB family protein [Burkholderia multivorans]SAJ96687.1 ninB family protein [Burkholderia multivorans]SAK20276.1 ninB family protein [Burkholderia multivorans]